MGTSLVICPLTTPGEGERLLLVTCGVLHTHTLQEEIPSIVDCPQPDHMTAHERRLARIAHEETSFDPDHYLYVK